jgi:2-oxoglutarate dehydrogenase E2 component (dihydrolipoamide succinyltransferase)
MSVDVKVPSVGESISEGVLSRWLKKDGDFVKSGEPLYELETEKATADVPSPADGVLKITIKEGATVAIGSVVGSIDTSAKAPAKKAEPKPAPAAARDERPPVRERAEPELPLSPAARQLVEEAGVDPSQITGTGRGGRITKEDVQAVIDKQQKAEAAPTPATALPRGEEEEPAPPTREVKAEGKGAARSETRQRMSSIRQRIAERLVAAQNAAAILTTFNEADMTAVMALRTRYKESFQKKHDVSLGFMGFFVKACVEALKTYPLVNSRIEGSDIVTPNYCDIGVAVSTERGLMVPVVRDCERKSFAAIEKAIAELAEKARAGKINVDDLQGGTFTISNGGVFGSLLSTPLLNPPQTGILGMHAIQKRPVVVDDQIVIRPMMYLALSYDHRLIDGREAVTFLVRVKECIENPERLLLEV